MMDVSRARQRIGSLYERLGRLLDTARGRSAILAASLYEHKVRCGKPQCKCAKGSYRHVMSCISFVEGGKSRTRVVRAGARADVEKMVRRYREVRRARREIRELFEELLAAVDLLSSARCEYGMKRYIRLVSKGQRVSGGPKRAV